MFTYNLASTSFHKTRSTLKHSIPLACSALLFVLPVSHNIANATSGIATSKQQNATQWQDYKVRKGDNLSVIFNRMGLSAKDALEVDAATADKKIFVRLIPGEKMFFLITDNDLQTIRYQISSDTVKVVQRTKGADKYLLSTEKLTANTAIVTENLAPKELSQPIADIQTSSPKEALNGTLKNEQITNNTLQSQLVIEKDATSNLSPEIEPTEEPQVKHTALQQILDQLDDSSDNWVYYTVKPNDNLSAIFLRAGLSMSDVAYIGQSSNVKSFNSMQVGEKIGFVIRAGHLVKVNYIVNQMKNILYTRTSVSKYNVEVFEKSPVTEYRSVAGRINNSFFIDALNAGLSNNVAMNFTKIFGWDVDFSQDVKSGDSFKVVYEELTVDGTKVKNGNIVAAQFDVGGQTLTGIFYKDAQGQAGFYTPEGRSMRKAFLRMPVELARISSKFNLRRKHPIWKTVRPHKGVDYAAKRGTPIMAAGKGTIVFRGRRGEYGNVIIIKHGSGIETLYAHMSGFDKSFTKGSKVSQGQVIGYVGSTGAVTGAHLHYEFRVDGVHKNPLTVKLTKPIGLDPEEMPAFKAIAQKALKKLQFNKEEKLASNSLDINI